MSIRESECFLEKENTFDSNAKFQNTQGSSAPKHNKKWNELSSKSEHNKRERTEIFQYSE